MLQPSRPRSTNLSQVSRWRAFGLRKATLCPSHLLAMSTDRPEQAAACLSRHQFSAPVPNGKFIVIFVFAWQAALAPLMVLFACGGGRGCRSTCSSGRSSPFLGRGGIPHLDLRRALRLPAAAGSWCYVYDALRDPRLRCAFCVPLARAAELTGYKSMSLVSHRFFVTHSLWVTQRKNEFVNLFVELMFLLNRRREVADVAGSYHPLHGRLSAGHSHRLGVW